MLNKLIMIVVIVAVIWFLNIFTSYFAVNYMSSKHRDAASMMEGLARATEIRVRVNQYFSTNGRFPTSNQELGIASPESYKNREISRATIGPNGTIQIDYAALDDASLIMQPFANYTGTGSAVQWECYAINIDRDIVAQLQEPNCTSVASLAEINAPVEAEATVDNLVNAIHARRSSLVRHFIKAGVNVNGLSRIQERPLIEALTTGDSTILAMLIEAGADINQRQGKQMMTPLMSASRSSCRSDSLRTLLAAGADIEAQDTAGMTALMYAAKAGNNNCVSTLLKSGADISQTDLKGNTALNYATHHGTASSVYTTLRNHEIKERQGGEFFYRLPASE